MKSIYSVLFVILIIFSGCGKKNTRLAFNYYKMSTFELESDNPNEKNYRKALKYVNKALAEEFKVEYVAQKATLLFLLGRENESLRMFKKALRLPVSGAIRSEILNNYACVLAQKGDQEKALELFNHLEKDKDYLTPEVALVNQAKIYYESKILDFAKKKLMKAINLAPDYVDAHYYLAFICYEMKDIQTAFLAVCRTLELEPQHKGAIELQALLGNHK